MDVSKFPTDLSNESTAQLQRIAKLIASELEQRGGFEGVVYTFIKKKVSLFAISSDQIVAMGPIWKLTCGGSTHTKTNHRGAKRYPGDFKRGLFRGVPMS